MQLFKFSFLLNIFNSVRGPSALEIYTDGSSKDGWGSWAYVVSRKGKGEIEKSGRVRRANSNTMEFQAAIEALKSVPENSIITLYSDSKILVQAMKAGDGPRSHQTQIDSLNQLSKKHKIKWQWIKAHSGNVLNERCDLLCTLARTTP